MFVFIIRNDIGKTQFHRRVTGHMKTKISKCAELLMQPVYLNSTQRFA